MVQLFIPMESITMSTSEERSIIELLETTVPIKQKFSGLLGLKDHEEFINLLDSWKNRVVNGYKEVWNFDGKLIALFLYQVDNVIEYYHDLAISKYGEQIKDKPDILTKHSAGAQSVLLNKIKGSMDVIPVEYDAISKESVTHPVARANEVFLNGKKWTPKAKANHGFVYISEVYYFLDVRIFAYHYYKLSLEYHSQKYAEGESDPEYWGQLMTYLYQQNPEAPAFRPAKVPDKVMESIKTKLKKELAEEEKKQYIERKGFIKWLLTVFFNIVQFRKWRRFSKQNEQARKEIENVQTTKKIVQTEKKETKG